MDTMTLAAPADRVARLAALLVASIVLAWSPVARGQARPPTPRPLIPPDPSTRRPKAPPAATPPAAVPAPEAASQGDGPPINVTCVGTNAPAAVHVYALTPRAEGAEGAVAAAPGGRHPAHSVRKGPPCFVSRWQWLVSLRRLPASLASPQRHRRPTPHR